MEYNKASVIRNKPGRIGRVYEKCRGGGNPHLSKGSGNDYYDASDYLYLSVPAELFRSRINTGRC